MHKFVIYYLTYVYEHVYKYLASIYNEFVPFNNFHDDSQNVNGGNRMISISKYTYASERKLYTKKSVHQSLTDLDKKWLKPFFFFKQL